MVKCKVTFGIVEEGGKLLCSLSFTHFYFVVIILCSFILIM